MPTLEITTMIGCPLMCNFCPQENLRVKYGEDTKYMSLDTFKTALSKIPSDTRIDFSGMAEAWVNPEATNMLRYAFEQNFRVSIYTTLYNWTVDTAQEVAELLETYPKKIDTFSIHFPDEYGNMKGWKYTKEWEDVYHIMINRVLISICLVSPCILWSISVPWNSFITGSPLPAGIVVSP